jgi:hypothetical protein
VTLEHFTENCKWCVRRLLFDKVDISAADRSIALDYCVAKMGEAFVARPLPRREMRLDLNQTYTVRRIAVLGYRGSVD